MSVSDPPAGSSADPVGDPIGEFKELLDRAKREETHDATAMTLATSDAAGRPSARMVLLKQVDERGFVFFTNYGSRKARELQANPRAALCIYWPNLAKQVRVEGLVERLPVSESDAYFASRSRHSRLGALASRQSEPLESRKVLLARYLELQTKYAVGAVPRPDFWGGYRLEPDRIEIWHNQLHRLHDRFLYERFEDRWRRSRLYP
ncbi:MAG: pyridoxamine 5'-phosphate oxidase [Acidobacteriota bacterium]|nr:pyridoxamine 5'-phosphate oxidase [Acidobacteriota bacterium]